MAFAALSLILAMVGVFGILRPLDPATFALVAIVVGSTAVLAIAGPAWRAVRIDPASALRNS